MTDSVNTIIRLIVDGEERAAAALGRVGAQGEAALEGIAADAGRARDALQGFGNVRFLQGADWKALRTQIPLQFGDFITQVAVGQNALIAFGQQGAQIASFLGPQGVFYGSLIAAAAILAAPFAENLISSQSAAEQLKEALDDLGDSLKSFESSVKTAEGGIDKIVEKWGVYDAKLVETLNLQRTVNAELARIDFGKAADAVARLSGELRTSPVASPISPFPALDRLLLGGDVVDARNVADRLGVTFEQAGPVVSAIDALGDAATIEQQARAVQDLQGAIAGLIGPGSSEAALRYAKEIAEVNERLREMRELQRRLSENPLPAPTAPDGTANPFEVINREEARRRDGTSNPGFLASLAPAAEARDTAEALRESAAAGEIAERAFRGAFSALSRGARSGRFELEDLLETLLDVVQVAAQRALVDPLAAAFGQGFGALVSGAAGGLMTSGGTGGGGFGPQIAEFLGRGPADAAAGFSAAAPALAPAAGAASEIRVAIDLSPDLEGRIVASAVDRSTRATATIARGVVTDMSRRRQIR